MKQTPEKGLLVVLSGPSGSGKNTILEKYLSRHKNKGVHMSVSATTRPPRPGEQDGVNYHFLTKEAFEAKITSGELVEWDIYCGHYYGTLKENIEKHTRLGYDTFLVITVEGARKVRQQYPEAVLVFILPPSWQVLYERITRRGADPMEKIAGRLAEAREEVPVAQEFDYLVINDEAERAAGLLAAIIRGERARTCRWAGFLKEYVEVRASHDQ